MSVAALVYEADKEWKRDVSVFGRGSKRNGCQTKGLAAHATGKLVEVE